MTRVSVEVWISNLFKKIKDREENPPEEEPEPVLEEGQEPPPKKSWLLPLEESAVIKLCYKRIKLVSFSFLVAL